MPAHDALPTWAELFRLTLPQMGLMLCHLIISMTDIWAAGVLGPEVQAAVGVITQIFAMMMLLTSLIGSGCMATVSQSLGAGLKLRASRYAGLIVMLSACGGTAVALMAFAAEPLIFSMMGVSSDIRPALSVFLAAYCCQLPFYYVLIMINSIFRAHKKVLFPLLTLALMTVANVVGDCGFGLGMAGMPAFGVAGIAWTTFAAALLGLASNIALAVGLGVLSRVSFAPWRWCRRAMPYLFRVGVPAAAGHIIMQAGSLATLAIVSALPSGSTPALAGMSLGSRVHSFLMFPLGAFSMSMAILGGHLLGAGRTEALFAFGRKTAFATGAVLLAPSLLLWIFRGQAAALFSDDAEVIGQASLFLMFSCLGGPLSGITGILHGVFAGAGATSLSCRIGAVTSWAVGIPLAWLTGIWLGWGPGGIYASGFAAQAAGAAWTLLLFQRKKWIAFGMRRRQDSSVNRPFRANGQ